MCVLALYIKKCLERHTDARICPPPSCELGGMYAVAFFACRKMDRHMQHTSAFILKCTKTRWLSADMIELEKN